MDFLLRTGVNCIVAIQSLGDWLEDFFLSWPGGIFLPGFAPNLLECGCGVGLENCTHSCTQ